jgi:hypothetical protein
MFSVVLKNAVITLVYIPNGQAKSSLERTQKSFFLVTIWGVAFSLFLKYIDFSAFFFEVSRS